MAELVSAGQEDVLLRKRVRTCLTNLSTLAPCAEAMFSRGAVPALRRVLEASNMSLNQLRGRVGMAGLGGEIAEAELDQYTSILLLQRLTRALPASMPKAAVDEGNIIPVLVATLSSTSASSPGVGASGSNGKVRLTALRLALDLAKYSNSSTRVKMSTADPALLSAVAAPAIAAAAASSTGTGMHAGGAGLGGPARRGSLSGYSPLEESLSMLTLSELAVPDPEPRSSIAMTPGVLSGALALLAQVPESTADRAAAIESVSNMYGAEVAGLMEDVGDSREGAACLLKHLCVSLADPDVASAMLLLSPAAPAALPTVPQPAAAPMAPVLTEAKEGGEGGEEEKEGVEGEAEADAETEAPASVEDLPPPPSYTAFTSPPTIRPVSPTGPTGPLTSLEDLHRVLLATATATDGTSPSNPASSSPNSSATTKASAIAALLSLQAVPEARLATAATCPTLLSAVQRYVTSGTLVDSSTSESSGPLSLACADLLSVINGLAMDPRAVPDLLSAGIMDTLRAVLEVAVSPGAVGAGSVMSVLLETVLILQVRLVHYLVLHAMTINRSYSYDHSFSFTDPCSASRKPASSGSPLHPGRAPQRLEQSAAVRPFHLPEGPHHAHLPKRGRAPPHDPGGAQGARRARSLQRRCRAFQRQGRLRGLARRRRRRRHPGSAGAQRLYHGHTGDSQHAEGRLWTEPRDGLRLGGGHQCGPGACSPGSGAHAQRSVHC